MDGIILITFDLPNLSTDMSCTMRLCINHIDENGNNLADWYDKSFQTSSIRSVLIALDSFEGKYQKWGNYCQYGETPFRIVKKLDVPPNQTHGYSTEKEKELRESCIAQFQEVTLGLNKWLNTTINADNICGLIRRKVREMDGNNLSIKLAFQTKVNELQNLHWEKCTDSDLFIKLKGLQEFDLTESSINTILGSRVVQQKTRKWNYPLKVLVIVGANDELNTDLDLEYIETYLGFKPEICQQPSIEKLTELLSDRNWDVVIYLGHSSSHPNGSDGEIIVNNNQTNASLSIDDLRNAFAESIDKGLQVLLFISCDGTGLVRKLYEVLEEQQKRLPYVIVMRRKIGDSIANTFVKRFAKFFFEDGYSIEESVTKSNAFMRVYQSQFPGADSLATLWSDTRSPHLAAPHKPIRKNPQPHLWRRIWKWLLEAV